MPRNQRHSTRSTHHHSTTTHQPSSGFKRGKTLLRHHPIRDFKQCKTLFQRHQKNAPFALQPFRFLSLPPELRLEIYSHVINPPETAYPVAVRPPGTAAYRRSIEEVSILRINQQIHHEVAPLLYRTPTFKFTKAVLLEEWLDRKRGYLGAVRNVKLHLPFELPSSIIDNPESKKFNNGNWIRALSKLHLQCPNLQTLSLQWWDVSEEISSTAINRNLVTEKILESGIRDLKSLVVRLRPKTSRYVEKTKDGYTKLAHEEIEGEWLERQEDLKRRLAPMLNGYREDVPGEV